MKIKYVIIGIGIIVLLSLYYFSNPSEVNYFPKCPFYWLTGFYCPGCGSQRALHHLLHFDIINTIDHNALYIVGLSTIAYNVSVNAMNKFGNKIYYNYLYHPKTPLIIGGLIIVFWILRNINLYPFTILAP